MNKMKNFAKKIGLTAFAVAALPMAAMAEDPASADATKTMVDDLVAKVDFSTVITGIGAIAGGLMGVYLAVLAFRFIKGMVSRG